jgi:hypothetical protein
LAKKVVKTHIRGSDRLDEACFLTFGRLLLSGGDKCSGDALTLTIRRGADELEMPCCKLGTRPIDILAEFIVRS